jgi:hypothetical protein
MMAKDFKNVDKEYIKEIKEQDSPDEKLNSSSQR